MRSVAPRPPFYEIHAMPQTRESPQTDQFIVRTFRDPSSTTLTLLPHSMSSARIISLITNILICLPSHIRSCVTNAIILHNYYFARNIREDFISFPLYYTYFDFVYCVIFVNHYFTRFFISRIILHIISIIMYLVPVTFSCFDFSVYLHVLMWQDCLLSRMQLCLK